MPSSNQYAIGVSTLSNFDHAIEEAISKLESPTSDPYDLISIFCSGYSAEEARGLDDLASSLSSAHLLGANCSGTMGGHKEYDRDEPSVVVWGAKLPEVELTEFSLRYEQSLEGAAFVGWPEDDSCLEGDAVLLAIGDPYSFPMDLLLHRLNEDRPELTVIGGMSSGSAGPGDWSVIDGAGMGRAGARLISMQGNNLPLPLVSQGCRPVGDPMLITACDRNEIQQLGGVPATQKLFELFDRLPTREQKLLNSGLQLGFAVTEFKDEFSYGDFLIRGVTGFDKDTGSLSVGTYARVGQTVQFHVRDHESATQDLNEICARVKGKRESLPKSALVFSCNGRGSNLFPEPDHDATRLSQLLELDSLAGFFAAGEIGPVGGKSHMHGYTASVALFY